MAVVVELAAVAGGGGAAPTAFFGGEEADGGDQVDLEFGPSVIVLCTISCVKWTRDRGVEILGRVRL